MNCQLYIVNTTDGVFKIPFKPHVSYDVKKRISGVIAVGKRCLIPSDVAPYIDEGRLAYHEQKREIRVIRKSLEVPKMGKEVFPDKPKKAKKGSLSGKKKYKKREAE